MSTFKEILDRVDDRVPNAFSTRAKLRWLIGLNGRLAAEVFMLDIDTVRALPQDPDQAKDAQPLISFPHEEIYELWLEARIHHANGDYKAYQNTMEVYNRSLSEFRVWYHSSYDPAQMDRPGATTYLAQVLQGMGA